MTQKKTPPTKTTKKKRKPRTPKPIAEVLARLPSTSPQQPEPAEEIGEDNLTPRQRIFIEEYLRCWNATEAARRAGYSDPEQSGWVNKHKVEVRAAMEARLSEHRLSADEVLARLSDHAMGTMGDFIGTNYLESGQAITVIDLERARRAGKLHLIKKIRVDEKGTAIELYDAKAALELLGKHYELFTEKQKLEGELTTRISNLNDLLNIAYGPKPEIPSTDH